MRTLRSLTIFTPTPHLHGLIPAVFTPMHADGSLHSAQIAPLTDHLLKEGAQGLYICGSTGEGPCLSREERMETAEAYIQAAAGRVPTIVQVGHQSIPEAQRLAEHAQNHGAQAISAIPPNYFQPKDLISIVDAMAEIASAAPTLPFYYYHIPSVTGVQLDLCHFLTTASPRIPNLVGAKFSHTNIAELQRCLEAEGQFNLLFGDDGMLLSALAVGVHGAVGSTYNFASPLYQRVIAAFEQGDIARASHWQNKAAQMTQLLMEHGGNPAIKSMMSLLGLSCGGTRLPQQALTKEQENDLQKAMLAIGFFEWGRLDALK